MSVSMSDDHGYRTLDFENPQDHVDVDRGANVIVGQLCARLDELADLIGQRGAKPNIHSEDLSRLSP
jgi:hypothetical protein